MKWFIGFLILSSVLSVFIGKFIAYGHGVDLENEE